MRTITLYGICFIFASCQVPIIEPILLPEIVEIVEIEPIEKQIVEEPVIMVLLEPIIIEEEEIYMKQFKSFEKYVFDGSRLHGLDGIEKEELFLVDDNDVIHPINDFFKVGEVIFFITKAMEQGEAIPDSDPVAYQSVEVTHFYQQIADDVQEIQEADYPVLPAAEFAVMKEGVFEIKVVQVKMDGVETDVSEVSQGTDRTAYIKITGYLLTDDGLWFSVSESLTPTQRVKGIYFYPNGGNIILKMQGRIW